MKEQVIIPPMEGWKKLTYYVVELAFSNQNPIHESIINTGFLDDKGKIQSIKIFNDTYDRLMNLEDVVFLRARSMINIQESSNSMKLPSMELDIEPISMLKRISDVVKLILNDSIVLGSGIAITDKYNDIEHISHEEFFNQSCHTISGYHPQLMICDDPVSERHYEIKSKQRSIEDQNVFIDSKIPDLKDKDGWYRVHDKKSKKNKF